MPHSDYTAMRTGMYSLGTAVITNHYEGNCLSWPELPPIIHRLPYYVGGQVEKTRTHSLLHILTSNKFSLISSLGYAIQPGSKMK